MSGKQKECGYSWTSEGEIHTCNLPEGHTEAHICGFVFNPSDCCLERAEPTPPEGEAVPEQAFCAGCGGLLPVGHAEIYQPSTGKRYHARCEHLAAPVVSTAAPEPPNRYWDIFTADDGSRLLRICWRKNEAGNFMAMEVAEFVTWNIATLQAKEEESLLQVLNMAEKDRHMLAVAPESYKPAEGPELSELIAQQGIKPIKTGHELEIPGLSDEDMEGFTADPAATPVTVEAPGNNPWHLFHRLWTKAVGTDGYIKQEWRDLEAVMVRAKIGQNWATPKPIGDVEAAAKTLYGKGFRYEGPVIFACEFGVTAESAQIETIAAILSPFFAPAGTASERFGVYIASKTKHAAKWRQLRSDGAPIISTWIDESGIGETKSFEDLWRRCINEAANAERLIVYAEEGDELKGALVEVGAALAGGTPVWVVGNVEALKTAKNHRLMRKAHSLKEALSAIKMVAPAQPPCSECATLRKERDDAKRELGIERAVSAELAKKEVEQAIRAEAAEAQLSTQLQAFKDARDSLNDALSHLRHSSNENAIIYVKEGLKFISAALAPTPEVAPKE